MSNKIKWIASYPKSGNTWVRLFLEAYLTGQQPDMQNTARFSIGDRNQRWYQAAYSKPLTEATDNEICQLRTAALLNLLVEYDNPIVKTHCSRAIVCGIQQIPGELTERAVYIVRDPRDVAVSLSHHNAADLDAAIDILLGNGATKEGSIPQYIGSWSKHVASWTTDLPVEMAGPPIETIVVKYEELLDGSALAWPRLLNAMYDGPIAAVRFHKAMRDTHFATLQEREQTEGFQEAKQGRAFFRSGLAGVWKDELTPKQIARIQEACQPMMERFGYELE